MSLFHPTKERLGDMLIKVEAEIKAWENSWGRYEMTTISLIREYNGLLTEKYKLEGLIKKLEKK